jgi:hypothetical protein
MNMGKSPASKQLIKKTSLDAGRLFLLVLQALSRVRKRTLLPDFVQIIYIPGSALNWFTGSVVNCSFSLYFDYV